MFGAIPGLCNWEIGWMFRIIDWKEEIRRREKSWLGDEEKENDKEKRKNRNPEKERNSGKRNKEKGINERKNMN